MINLEHAFDPSLSLLYTRQLTDRDGSGVNSDSACRQLFYQLNQHEKSKDIMSRTYEFITENLKQSEQEYSSLIIQDYSMEKLSSLKASKIESLPEHLLTQDNLNDCVNQTAAIQLTQPCWLQNIPHTNSSQTKTAIEIMSLYLQITLSKKGCSDLLKFYRSLLLTTGNDVPVLHSYGYSQQAELMSKMLEFATIQLALARFPRVFFAEILGFTLAYCQMPTLIEICFPKHQLPSAFFQLRYHQLGKQLLPLLQCITDYLDLFPQQQQALWTRIQNGFYLYQLQMQRCRDQFNDVLDKPHSSQQAVAELFQKKTMAAIGHHQKIQLQGKTLDSWFAGMPANNRDFLQALKQSEYVNRQSPVDSALLKLFDFKGPMFGIFDRSELEILKNWLKDESDETAINSIALNISSTPETSIQSPESYQPVKSYKKLNNRELYYYLINADLFPDVLPTAHNKARKLLRLCTLFNKLPFKKYSHDRFDAYIENIYQREMSAYQPLQGKPKISREAYVWGIEQIAPMILIDGCWLQNSLDLQSVSPDICDILYSIYCDELGNGKLEQNHPYIFQQLLDSLSIKVPPVHSKQFIEHPGFINSAFDLPAYMLSLSSFSVEFLPELLGLNMAIELSGLGNSYMRLVDEWNYWGIDPAIANIHISIDNYASGHTFLAKKAIQLYMDDILQRTGDQVTLDSHWRRIYSGYTSLRFVGGRFKLGLPVCYIISKFRNYSESLRLKV